MECDVDPAVFAEVAELIISSWDNPQIRFFIQSQGLRQEHINEVKRILSQIKD
ncbi:MAG: hypothetical protein ABIH11_03890 [Candidatus Altiarchaeota archaeon]